ncbi:tripartite tricarboxylate transporter TctB family protein [Saxibacter everestensis]|uniref:Tripartite tricarboxylate transporter TctB family protein n=1 Tax=Saxibacter everestensis TaxID=2909229 RepID=A0ABY8QUZ9_9MICO|nr:tripartite tricarboxylate transporter TctB family protein [Brevibacteriaceae bacterium ZFBP1038]
MKSLHVSRRSDFTVGWVVAAVGLAYFINTFFVETTDDVVDPATFPRIVGVGLIVLGVLLSLSALRPVRQPAAAEATAGSATTAETTGNSVTESHRPTVAESAAEAEAALEASVAGDDAQSSSARRLRVLLYFAVFFAYLLILIPVGFLVATAVFLFAVTTLYARDKWLRNIIFAVAFSAVVYFGFKYGLGVFLPPGILG